MINYIHNQPFIPLSDEDPFGLIQTDLELSIPEIAALSAIHRVSNAKDDQEASLSLYKRVRAETTLPDIDAPPGLIQETAVQSVRKRGTKHFSTEEDQKIVNGLNANQSFEKIAEGSNRTVQQMKRRWYSELSKLHPEIQVQRDNARDSIFTEEEDWKIAEGIEAGKSYRMIAKELKFHPNQVAERWRRHLQPRYPHIVYRYTHKRKSSQQPPAAVAPIDPYTINNMQIHHSAYLNGGIPAFYFPFTYWKH